MNVLTVTGNLGKDCRIGNAGGSAVCNFNVAVKSGYGDNEQTLWVDCALWGKQAESRLPDYLKKGQQVAVSGELGTREHDGKTYLTMRVSSIDLIGKREDNAAPQTTAGGQQQPPQTPATPSQPNDIDFDDDIPF